MQFYDNNSKPLKGENCYWDEHLDISYNSLTTLNGCPYEVKGGFYCHGNPLVNLIGCPQIIQGCFSCSQNQLISLEGHPKEVKGNFDCSRNQLTTLSFLKNILIEAKIISSHNNISVKSSEKALIKLYKKYNIKYTILEDSNLAIL